ncbi:MAG: Nif3-like dinuclear metal center hexameric protein [Oscillospiraceae bacterium]|nr:Nif3-like dinuclear metal center hexameric protein [Oscillospiraceae bacterium]
MPTVKDIFLALTDKAPLHYAADFDNAGFLLGRASREVKKVVVALDITGAVIKEAKEKGAELIVSHHPVIFGNRTRITDEDVTGSLLLDMAESKIAAICMHTNLDAAQGGVNDILADVLGVLNTEPIEKQETEGVGIGRVGTLREPVKLNDFLERICTALSCGGVKYHDAGREVFRVSVGGGACADYIGKAAELGFDTIVTADIKHNWFLEASERRVNAIDAGHFATEDIVCPYICDIIKKSFPKVLVEIAESNVDCTRFFTV